MNEYEILPDRLECLQQIKILKADLIRRMCAVQS